MTRENDLRIVTDAMPAAAVRCARDRSFLWVNPRYSSWIALPPSSIVGRKLSEVIGPEAALAIEPYVQRVLKGEQVQYERLAKFAGLGERWVNWMYTPTEDGWVAIGTDIHDRKLAEEALRQEQQRKDAFLAALAHELRNPLAPIRNAVAILEKKGPLDPELAWSRAVIERQIEQLSRLIGDLVDIERIATGKLALRRERISFEAVVDMALETSRPHITAGGHRLSVLLPSERAMLDADPARLAQAIATLLKNAAKHTPAQGTIGLSAAIEAREVVLCVEDSGAGLEPQAADALLRGGAGVGLSLVQGSCACTAARSRCAAPGAGGAASSWCACRLLQGLQER
jgi:PAS domain S-box-containing protein